MTSASSLWEVGPVDGRHEHQRGQGMSTVIQIIKAHLTAGGFDGLMNSESECACDLADLQPCGESFGDCSPGYRGADPESPGCWRMYSSKEAAEASLAAAGAKP